MGNRAEMVFGLLLAVRSGQQLINAPATMCPMYSDRAAGICGQITDIPTPKTSASPGVCLRGIGGPCTFVATCVPSELTSVRRVWCVCRRLPSTHPNKRQVAGRVHVI